MNIVLDITTFVKSVKSMPQSFVFNNGCSMIVDDVLLCCYPALLETESF